MSKKKSGEGTLLASVLLSAPGPLVVGLGLLVGRSATQLADFIRRSAELAAIVVSWIVFRKIRKEGTMDIVRKRKLERWSNFAVGTAMVLSGGAMLMVALFLTSTEKGNVIPGLVIAVLGVITNTWFFFRYRGMDRKTPNRIFQVQSRLYLAKSLVDGCVVIALGVIVIMPNAGFTAYVDVVGSVVVALYLIANGLLTIRGKNLETVGSSGSS